MRVTKSDHLKKALAATLYPMKDDQLRVWSELEAIARGSRQRDDFHHNNRISIDGLPSNVAIPLFSGANNNLERVTLDSTVTLDCTVGWRLSFKVLANGDWDSGSPADFCLMGDLVLSYLAVSNSRISIYDNFSQSRTMATTANLTHKLYNFEIVCDGALFTVYRDGEQISITSILAVTLFNIDFLGYGRFREAQGLLYDIKVNDVDSSENWTHHWSGINGDWSDQIGSNNGTAGVNLKYIKNNHNNLKAKTGGYASLSFVTQDYIDGNKVLQFGNYEGGLWFKSTQTSDVRILDSRDGFGDGFLVRLNSGFISILHNTDQVITSNTYNDDNWYYILYSHIDSLLTLTIYSYTGVLLEEIEESTTGEINISTNFRIGCNSYSISSLFSGSIKDVWHRSGISSIVGDEFANNPQNFNKKWFSEIGNVDFAYSFNQGNGEVGYTVFDLSGNDQHGTIQSNLAPAGTNFIYNDAEVGSQQVLESRNVYEHLNGTDRYADVSGIASNIAALSAFTVKGSFIWEDGVDTIEGIFTNGTTRSVSRANICRSSRGNLQFIVGGSSAGIVIYGGTTLLKNTKYDYTATIKIESGYLIGSLYLNEVLDGNGSITETSTDFSYLSTDWKIGHLSKARYFKGLIPNTEIYSGYSEDGTVDGLTKLHGWNGIDFTDDTGSVDGVLGGTEEKIHVPESSIKGIDLFGNAITKPYYEGQLNTYGFDLVENKAGGLLLGDQTDTLDYDSRTFMQSIEYISNGAVQVISENRTSGDGYTIWIDANGFLNYTNEVGGVATTLTSTLQMISGQTYSYAISHTGTAATMYVMLSGDNVIPMISDTATVGLIGTGSTVVSWGYTGTGTYPFAGRMSKPLVFEDSIAV